MRQNLDQLITSRDQVSHADLFIDDSTFQVAEHDLFCFEGTASYFKDLKVEQWIIRFRENLEDVFKKRDEITPRSKRGGSNLETNVFDSLEGFSRKATDRILYHVIEEALMVELPGYMPKKERLQGLIELFGIHGGL